MTGASPAPAFARRVIAWQRSHGRHRLPWQRTRDPYRVWLSEIMLQQTQVATVLGYYERFLARFPDVGALAAAPLDDVLALWSGLGYYSRARNLHRAAQIVVAEHGGEFPRTAEALARLPGIGRSTAAAIAAFCFGERAAILDGNVKRVLTRVLGFEGDMAQAASERALWREAEALLPGPEDEGSSESTVLRVAEPAPSQPFTRHRQGDGADADPRRAGPAARGGSQAHDDIASYTQGLMDLGAAICTPRAPKCLLCPAAEVCTARRRGEPERYPVKSRKAGGRPRRESWWLWLEHGGSVLLRKRPASGVWAGLWTLPLYDDPAALDAAAARLGAPATEPLAPVEHGLTHFDWRLHPRFAALVVRPKTNAGGEGGEESRWFRYDELAAVALPAPLRKLLAARSGG